MSIMPAPLSNSPMAMPPGFESSVPTLELTKRYVDAYRVANFQAGLGATIKNASLGIGGIILLLSLSYAATSATPQPGFFGPSANSIGVALGLFGAMIGFVIGGIGFILGILISSEGQILKATLDSAVNSSPFLDNTQRIGIMSL